MFGMKLSILSTESRVNSPFASTFWYIPKNEIAKVGISDNHEKKAVIDAPSFFWEINPISNSADSHVMPTPMYLNGSAISNVKHMNTV
jgi:hypothetical protein